MCGIVETYALPLLTFGFRMNPSAVRRFLCDIHSVRSAHYSNPNGFMMKTMELIAE